MFNKIVAVSVKAQALPVNTLGQVNRIRFLNDVAEIGRYFRDRFLDNWWLDPTPEHAALTLKGIVEAFNHIHSPLVRDLPLLVRGAEIYLSAKLGIDVEAPKLEPALIPAPQEEPVETMRDDLRGGV